MINITLRTLSERKTIIRKIDFVKNVAFFFLDHKKIFFRKYRAMQVSTHLNNLYDNDGNIKLQASTSKSLPNTPKSGEIQIKQRRTRASSAVVSAKRRTKDDFRNLDAYLERKQMEKHGNHLALKSHSNNTRSYDENSDSKYPLVHNYTDTELHLLNNHYLSNSAFNIQNEEKLKLWSKQYQEDSKSDISIENDLQTGWYLSCNFYISMI